MTKPTVEQVMQLANEYAHCYSFVGDDTMPRKHRELRAAIEALAAPDAPQQAEPVKTHRWWTDSDELLLDSARDILIKSSIRAEGNEDAILRLMKAAPQQAEPVSHLYECLGRWAAHLANSLRTADRAPPQYLIDAINAATHSPVDEVQRLRAVLCAAAGYTNIDSLTFRTGPAFDALVKAVRRALEGK